MLPELSPRLERRLAWAAAVAAVAWAGAFLFVRWPVLRWPSFQSRVPPDNAVFAVAGDLIRRGGAPYVAYWDHKGPLIHLTNALGLAASGGALWGVWAVSFLALALALVLCLRATLRPLGPPAALLVLAVMVAGMPALHATNLTEEFALPLQWATVLVFARWHAASRRALALGLAIGALGMLAFFYRANLVGASAAAALASVIVMVRSGRARDLVRLVAGGLLGALAVTGALVGYLAARGSLADFWDQAIRFNVHYAARGGLGVGGMLAYGARLLGPVLLSLGVAGLVASAWRARRVREADGVSALALLVTLWVPLELALGTLSGRAFQHYYLPLAQALALGAGVLAASVPAHARVGRVSQRVAMPIALTALLALLTLASLRRDWWRIDARGRRTQQVELVVAFIRQHTRPDEAILVWGHDADVYALADRRPATRYLYPLPLVSPGYTDSTTVARFLDDVRRTDPRLIIEGPFMPLERLARLVHDPSSAGSPEVARLPIAPMVAWFEGRYRLVTTLGPGQWPVYVRKDVTLPAR